MKDSRRRGIRTAIDVLLSLVTTGALQALLLVFDTGLSEAQFAAISLVLVPILSAWKNSLEDSGTIPAFLKSPASDGVNPV